MNFACTDMSLAVNVGHQLLVCISLPLNDLVASTYLLHRVPKQNRTVLLMFFFFF